MAKMIFDNGHHKVLMFSDLVHEEELAVEAVQANQFLIIHGDTGILLDPGGAMTYHQLYMEIGRYFPPKKLTAIFASHQDPDIVASLSRWLSFSDTKLIISTLWSRFVPHFCYGDRTQDRIIPIDDEGAWINVGGAEYAIIPAHFLHSEGNFQLYDPISKLLFSGDLGVSLLPQEMVEAPVTDFKNHIQYMEGFHKRYMTSNRVGRLWAAMIRELDIEGIIPQHGAPFMNKKVIKQFIEWIENLECGVDLINQSNYKIPAKRVRKIEDMPTL